MASGRPGPASYGVFVLPVGYPGWLIAFMQGSGGWLPALIGAVIMRMLRHRPWQVTVYRLTTFRLRSDCTYRKRAESIREANREARLLNAELKQGRVPTMD